jgi:hypothetical protein
MPARRRCAACGAVFKVSAHVPDQSYCSADACQRERRKLWQRVRRIEDPDYRDNQARAQEAWLTRNPDYWRIYRERHPEYTERNRSRQRDRSRERRGSNIANTDVQAGGTLPASGRYRLTVLSADGLAKMNTSVVVELVRIGNDRH